MDKASLMRVAEQEAGAAIFSVILCLLGLVRMSFASEEFLQLSNSSPRNQMEQDVFPSIPPISFAPKTNDRTVGNFSNNGQIIKNTFIFFVSQARCVNAKPLRKAQHKNKMYSVHHTKHAGWKLQVRFTKSLISRTRQLFRKAKLRVITEWYELRS